MHAVAPSQSNLVGISRPADPNINDLQQKNILLDKDKVQDLLGLSRTWEPGL